MDDGVGEKLRGWLVFGLGVVLLAPAAFMIGNGLRMQRERTLLEAAGAVALFVVGRALINWYFRRRPAP